MRSIWITTFIRIILLDRCAFSNHLIYGMMPMKMKPQCEALAKHIIPVLRARVARVLALEYGMQQYEISKKLGVTQAAVSFYLSQARGADAYLLKKFPDIDRAAKRMAKAIVAKAGEDEISDILCNLCTKLRKKKGFKSLMR